MKASRQPSYSTVRSSSLMFDNRQGSDSGLAALLRLAQSRTYAN